MATVLRAKTAGFCMGVGLALRKLDQALKEHRARSSGRLVMLGPIIPQPASHEHVHAAGGRPRALA